MKLLSWTVLSVGMCLIFLGSATPVYAVAAPEIDPGSLGGAMAVLTGGLLILTDRIRRK